MKLLEALEMLRVDNVIKIGSNSGYFYVGKLGDLHLEELDAKCKGYAIQRLTNARVSLDTTIKNAPTPGSFAKFRIQRYDATGIDMDGWNARLEDFFKQVNANLKAINTAQERLEGYVSILDREVKDMKKSIPTVDNGVVLIVIEGYEDGAYWTTDEAETLPSTKFGIDTEADNKEEEEA